MPKRLTNEQFAEKGNIVHDYKYDYSVTKYTGAKNEVDILCPPHGLFTIIAGSHISKRAQGCPKCAINYVDTKIFTEHAHKVQGTDKYDYSKVDYKNAHTDVLIICNICFDEFLQTPSSHLQGHGCPACAKEKTAQSLKLTFEEFERRSNETHSNRYIYPKVEWKGVFDKIPIKCRKHGTFFQTPHNHYNGQGCPDCKKSIGETLTEKFLDEMEIKFERQKRFDSCKNKKPLPFDFYILKYNLTVEYQGLPHFKPVEFFGGEEAFEYRKKNDSIKENWCRENNINLLKIGYKREKDIKSILEKVFERLENEETGIFEYY